MFRFVALTAGSSGAMRVWRWLMWFMAAGLTGSRLMFAAEPADPGLNLRGSLTGHLVRHWKSEDGLPQNTVQAVLQSRDGCLWIGTPEGLARFDGLRFVQFHRENTPALVENDNCLALAEDREGRLWVATPAGLVCWEENVMVRIPLPNPLAGQRIRTLCAGADGGLWIATEERLHHWLAGAPGMRSLDLYESQQHPRCLFEDAGGRLWLGNRTGLHQWDQGRWSAFGEAQGLAARAIAYVGADRGGGLWVVTRHHADRTGQSALHHLDNGRFSLVPLPAELSGRELSCFAQDHEGSLWIGAVHDGLHQLQPRRIRTWTTRSGLADNFVCSVGAARRGGVWVATDGGLQHLEAGLFTSWFTNYVNPRGLRRSRVTTVVEDATGAVWFGTLNKVCCLENGRANCFLPPNRRNDFIVSTLLVDRAGRRWIGSRDGLARHHDGQLTLFGPEDGLTEPDVRALLEDRDGGLWVGTDGGGLFQRHGERFKAWAGNASLPHGSVRALHEDAEGALWIVTEAGLSRARDGHVFVFTPEHGLPGGTLNSLLEDDQGFMWITHNRGLFRANRRELTEVSTGRRSAARGVAFGEADGMATSETSGGTQPAGVKTTDGRLWFATVGGLAMVDPRQVQLNEQPPPVRIEQVVADGEPIFGDGAVFQQDGSFFKAHGANTVRASDGSQPKMPRMQLRPGRARVLQIRYTANSFAAPAKVRFRYRMEGHDPGWREETAERAAYYTNLRPGSYNFRVKACNDHGLWNETGANFAFVLTPYFHQTWPFYVLCAGAAGFTAWIAHRVRVAGVRRRLGLEKRLALALERERIAKDMHDDLGASVTQIGLLSEQAKLHAAAPDRLRADLEKLTVAARLTGQAMEEIVWAVNPRQDTLESFANYLCQFTREYLEATSVRCRLDVPTLLPGLALPSDIRHNLVLVAKEALTNVLKHAGATEVWVRLQHEESRLALVVEDNGNWLNPEAAPSGPSPGSGNGLSNMRRRMESLGGSFELESRPGCGSRVTATIRLDANAGSGP